MPVSAAKDRALEIFVLGPFRVVVDRQEVDERRLARRKPKLLVKLLALNPHRQMHRDELQDVLWPDLDPEAAANQLHKVIYQARRMLEPTLGSASASRFIGTQDRMVLLRAPGGAWVDADEFSRLAAAAAAGQDPRAYEAALALYGGELLVEDPYEDCFALRREQLRATHRELVARLASLCETTGDVARSIDLLRGLVALDPWNEEVHRTLMRLYLASGSRSHALAQYEQCREALRRELDVEPDAETLAVRDRIVSGAVEPAPPAAAPGARPPNNLPRQITSFVGRASSVAEAERLLASGRLLTLAGPGGIGKTRLALRLAEGALSAFPEGVWVVELAPLADPALVPEAVAAVLGVRGGATDSVVGALAAALAARRALLVLDNCEHLVAACSSLVAALLRECPDLHVLTTSREPLGLFGEAVYRVVPMGAPDPRRAPPADQLPHYESVRLFLDRVQLHDPSFEITATNAPAVAEICHRLDGIPLAIELAAARTRALALDAIVARLATCFRVLSGGDRAALPRQQTMRSAVDWSYALLMDEERALLRRLAIFAGSAPLDAIESVCSDAEAPAADVLDLLTRLVDKSLVTAERGDDVRYRLLEPIRQYAFERLEQAGESARLLDAHAAWFVSLAERAEPNLFGPEQSAWFARLDVEHDNLRAVLRRTIDLGGRDDALRICAALGQFWDVRGYFAEGRMWIEAAIAAAPAAPSAIRGKAINVAGSLAILQGDYGLAAEYFGRSLALRRAAGEQGPLARTLHSLAYVVKCLGDTRRALELQRESLELFREVDDRLGIALAMSNVGLILMDEGEFDRAEECLLDSLARQRELGNERGMAIMFHNLGDNAQRKGDAEAAERYLARSTASARKLGDPRIEAYSTAVLANVAIDRGDLDRGRELLNAALASDRTLDDKAGIAYALWGHARLRVACGEWRGALELAGAAEALGKSTGVALAVQQRAALDEMLAPARRALGDAAAAHATAFGAGLGLDDVLRSLDGGPPSPE